MQHAIFIYDQNGIFLDAILSPDLTLSEFVDKHTDEKIKGASYSYNIFSEEVTFVGKDGDPLAFPSPDIPPWSPLGVRLDEDNRLLISNVGTKRNNAVLLDLGRGWDPGEGDDFSPEEDSFGATGQGNGELLFPNVVVVDSQGRYFITDGNNGRISVWSPAGEFLFNFGMGTGDGSLSLPRGAAVDQYDRLYVVDAVGQDVKVYDVSGEEPEFLFSFGGFGADDGLFNYPTDIAIDTTGRIYVTDRENNRVQVWSY